jgi:hypothetical protein
MATKRLKSAFTFLGTLLEIEGNYIAHGIYLPHELISQLPAKRLRAKGTINGVPFALAVQYRKSGERFFMISKKLVKDAQLKLGARAEVKFTLVNPDIVDVPEELEAVLEQDAEAKKVWLTFTKGLQRSLIHYVTSAKNVDVRIKRSLELIDKAKNRTLLTQRQKQD